MKTVFLFSDPADNTRLVTSQMPLFAILLLVGSAVLHTAWNLILKQAGDKYIVTWWALLLGSSVFLPFIYFTGLPAAEIWPLLLISVLVEIAYYILLSTAYRDADFSLIYPLSRGAAPALIAIWSVLFLGERLSIPGILGLLIIVSGLLIVASGSLVQLNGTKPHLRGILFALALAFLISIYSTIDGAAVKQTQAFPYAVLIFFLAPLFTTPIIFRVYGWKTLQASLAAHWLKIISVGLLAVFAYLLALAAYSVAPVSYTGAIREVSVVMGAFAGWQFLHERMGGWRLFGSLLIFSGIVVIAFFG